MGLGTTRSWALSLLGAIALALVLAACEEATAPTSTPAPTSTAVPTPTLGLTAASDPTATTVQRPTSVPTPTAAPTATSAPTPTAAPTSTAAPTATPAPAPSSAPPPETSAGLLEKLSLIPASFKDKGVWYGDLGRALEMAGVQPPRSRDDLADRDTRDAYLEARGWVVMAPDFMHGVFGEQEWEAVFGFNGYEVTAAVGFGGTILGLSTPSSAAYLEGDFDGSVIRQKLRDLGYEEIAASGRSYFSLNEDNSWGSLSSPGGIAVGSMNRVYVSDSALIVAPATAYVTDVLAAWANEAPSLADDVAVSGIARALGDPLSAALFTREELLNSEDTFADLAQYEKPEDWGAIHEWSDMGAGYGRGEKGEWWIISIFYHDPDAADADAEELINRMWGYDTAAAEFVEPGGWVQNPIDQWCSGLTANTRPHEGGSILSVRCEMKEDSGTALHLVEARDLAFLLP